MTLWNIVLTAALALLGYIAKTMWDETQRLNILVNRTREEVARECVTKSDVHHDIDRVISRLDAMDAKIDRIMEIKK